MSILVLQSSWWGRESWLLCLVCLPGVSWWLCGSSSRCHGFVCGLWLWYFLIIITYFFGYNCQSARRKYHIAKKNNIKPSETNKTYLQTASNTYKSTMNKCINKHNKQMQQKLRNLKHKNHKEFWKIINNIERKGDDPDISIDTLYEYFKI